MRPETGWTGQVIASVPYFITDQGRVDEARLRHLVSDLREAPIGGVALGSLIGRAWRPTDHDFSLTVRAWKEGLRSDKSLVVAVGAPPEVRRPLELLETAFDLARLAAESGADALLLLPPVAVRGRPERDRLILEYHARVAEAGLPIFASYRREALGGINYGPEVLAQLLARPEVLGVEIATIDGISTFQQVEALVREYAPEKLVVSGEERFLGYSLMCGANLAMVGIGAVDPAVVADLLDSHFSPDPARFLKRSREVDALARPIFRAPFDGTNDRLIATLAKLKILPD